MLKIIGTILLASQWLGGAGAALALLGHLGGHHSDPSTPYPWQKLLIMITWGAVCLLLNIALLRHTPRQTTGSNTAYGDNSSYEGSFSSFRPPKRCWMCRGEGTTTRGDGIPGNMVYRTQTCSSCHGTGWR